MTPYIRAHHTWHSNGTPAIAWNDLLTWFLHNGVLWSTPEGFLLARPALMKWPDAVHNTLSPLTMTDSPDCWNVWLAAGSLAPLLHLAKTSPLPWVSFCRRGGERLRRYPIRRLHDLAQDSQDSGPAATGFLDQ